jgi:dolichol-phosphate mannosyltransferase
VATEKRTEKKSYISIVVSAFNEEGNILKLYEEIIRNLKISPQIKEYEIIFVNDGSKDRTLEICTELAKKDKSVKILDFERNFGHEIAMTAGLDYASGDAVIFMDADLQHPPSYIPLMIKEWVNGYDIVLTKILKNDQKTFLRTIVVSAYYRILNFFSDIEIPKATPDFRLIGRRYMEILRNMNEQERMFRGMLYWLGAKNAKILDFEAPKRFSGKTHYNFRASLKLAINGIVQFSIKPLRIATYLGLISATFALLFAGFILFEYFAYKKAASGFTTTVLLISFFSSVQLVILGIIGEYVGRIHLETKKRPLYFSKLITYENAK